LLNSTALKWLHLPQAALDVPTEFASLVCHINRANHNASQSSGLAVLHVCHIDLGDGFEVHSFGDNQRGLFRGVVHIAGGSEHALAVMADGTLQAWVSAHSHGDADRGPQWWCSGLVSAAAAWLDALHCCSGPMDVSAVMCSAFRMSI
jgi:hypothetical protein